MKGKEGAAKPLSLAGAREGTCGIGWTAGWSGLSTYNVDKLSPARGAQTSRDAIVVMSYACMQRFALVPALPLPGH